MNEEDTTTEPSNPAEVEGNSSDEKDHSSTNDASSNLGQSSFTSTNNSKDGSNKDMDQKAESMYFATAESRKVRKLKKLIVLMLIGVTVGVCLAVYFITANGQRDEFESTFESTGIKVTRNFEKFLEQNIASIAGLSVSITASYLQEVDATWPFYVLNNFQERATATRIVSQCLFMEILPHVSDGQRLDWEKYSMANIGWLSEGRAYQSRLWSRQEEEEEEEEGHDWIIKEIEVDDSGISNVIFEFDGENNTVPAQRHGSYFPVWQMSPIPPVTRNLINFNANSYQRYAPYIKEAMETGAISVGAMETAPPGGIHHPNQDTHFYAYILSQDAEKEIDYNGEPMSRFFVPIMSSFEEDAEPAALMIAIIRWSTYFKDIIDPSAKPVHVVLENSCDEVFTFVLEGTKVAYLGPGNLADKTNEDMMIVFDLDEEDEVNSEDEITFNQNLCQYTIRVYPSNVADSFYNDNFPSIFAGVIAAVFIFTAGVFLIYDMMVEKRQELILNTAKRSTAIVSSMFPARVRDQLMAVPVQGNATKLRSFAYNSKASPGSQQEQSASKSVHDYRTTGKPIADLFPDFMFADVEGFTAWSSVREPSQVFTLLESIYAAFDKAAVRRAVFKVETVGDCYVAVAGLPDPAKNHATRMARFARDCLHEHGITVKQLESHLGPDTGDLRLRVGLHSGPVTAGVLRGERSRFQIFGDTVNTASRLESSGKGGKIQVSEETAALLGEDGKDNWVIERNARIHAKGKGEMKTFWLQVYTQNRASGGEPHATPTSEQPSPSVSSLESKLSTKTRRLVDWNVNIIVRMIEDIVVARQVSTASSTKPTKRASTRVMQAQEITWRRTGTNPIEEVLEVISFPPKKNNINAMARLDFSGLSSEVVQLVKDYVAGLAVMYHDNPFHCFEHASHVTMSVAKLLSRIISPSDMDFTSAEQAGSQLHDHTYGITSDPLTRFACILSALIHDVDHKGVTNNTLVAENANVAIQYKGKSVAEQNSVDLAWNLLMEDRFKPLIATLCCNSEELARLRQLVVNGVMATDIMDPELKKLRNQRWDRAFHEDVVGNARSIQPSDAQETIDRKATIVIEHLLQASDVSHTMQHWNVYIKWNARLFSEMYKAYLDGRRGAKDPSEFWTQGELGFFDFYIIPLAKKLKECGVFGVSSDEYLNYALSNRSEWATKGPDMVKDFVKQVRAEYGRLADLKGVETEERIH